MATRRFSSRRQVRSSRKGTSWARNLSATFTTVPAASKVLVGSFVLSNPGITETAVRSRGRIWIQSDQGAALEEQQGALGLVVVSDLALAAGAASIPGPATDSSDDGWFVWEGFSQTNIQVSAGTAGQLYEFDSKAARRVQEGFAIAIMAENVHATHGLDLGLVISLLAVVNT